MNTQSYILSMRDDDQEVFQGEIYLCSGKPPNETFQLYEKSPKFKTYTEALNWCEVIELNLGN